VKSRNLKGNFLEMRNFPWKCERISWFEGVAGFMLDVSALFAVHFSISLLRC
jgi:hypothetical protein